MTAIKLPRAVVQQVRDSLIVATTYLHDDADLEFEQSAAAIAALDEALAQPTPTPELPPFPEIDPAQSIPYASVRYIAGFTEDFVKQYAQAYARAALAQRGADPDLIEATRAQHDRDSAELCRLCQARDDARRERDLCRAEKAGMEASIGNLSRLIDDLRQGHDRYQYLRDRDLSAIDEGSIFAGLTPDNLILNGDDLDAAIDAALANRPKEGGQR